MMSIVIGLFLIALGVWGVIDEHYYVMDFLKGGVPIVLMLGGMLAALAGIVPCRQEEDENV